MSDDFFAGLPALEEESEADTNASDDSSEPDDMFTQMRQEGDDKPTLEDQLSARALPGDSVFDAPDVTPSASRWKVIGNLKF